MQHECANCRALRTRVETLEYQMEKLRERMSQLKGGISSVADFLDGQMSHPSMGSRAAVEEAHARVDCVINDAAEAERNDRYV